MLEVFRQDVFREFLVLWSSFSGRAFHCRVAVARIFVLTSSTTKLSPSLPQRTTLSSCGLSSILKHHCKQALQARSRSKCLLVELAHLLLLACAAKPRNAEGHLQSRWSCSPGQRFRPCWQCLACIAKSDTARKGVRCEVVVATRTGRVGSRSRNAGGRYVMCARRRERRAARLDPGVGIGRSGVNIGCWCRDCDATAKGTAGS